MAAPLLIAKLALQAKPLANWLWANRALLKPAHKKVEDFATTAIANPNGAVRRIGNTIVLTQPDGDSQVLAFIEQATPKLQQIQNTVAQMQGGQDSMLAALASLQTGQNAISSSVAAIQTLSMVSLGITALLPSVLHMQFAALNKRLNALLAAVQSLNKKFNAGKIALLRTGIDFLQLGIEMHELQKIADARQHYNAGLHDCIRSVHYFHQLLSDALNDGSPNRDEVRVLARHLSVAVLGVASCHIGLEDDTQAIARIEEQIPLLRQAAKWVFQQTAGKDSARFLSLPVGNSEVTLAFMADLFQQAQQVSAIDSQRDYSPADWFEEHRATISPFTSRLPYTHKSRYIAGLQRELMEAVAAVEEANRVQGIGMLVRNVRDAGECNREVMSRIRQSISNENGDHDDEHLVWTLAPLATPAPPSVSISNDGSASSQCPLKSA